MTTHRAPFILLIIFIALATSCSSPSTEQQLRETVEALQTQVLEVANGTPLADTTTRRAEATNSALRPKPSQTPADDGVSAMRGNWRFTPIHVDLNATSFLAAPGEKAEAAPDGYRFVMVDLEIENVGSGTTHFEPDTIIAAVKADKEYEYRAVPQSRYTYHYLPPGFRIRQGFISSVPIVVTPLTFVVRLKDEAAISPASIDLARLYSDPGYAPLDDPSRLLEVGMDGVTIADGYTLRMTDFGLDTFNRFCVHFSLQNLGGYDIHLMNAEYRHPNYRLYTEPGSMAISVEIFDGDGVPDHILYDSDLGSLGNWVPPGMTESLTLCHSNGQWRPMNPSVAAVLVTFGNDAGATTETQAIYRLE